MSENSKVRSSHTRRAAIVYIRQSHPSQVENNRESTARQYALVDKAMALGWDRNQVTTIDEDLGVSGKVFVKRSGFDHLNAEVALGRVGILLGLEVSRLARSNADWYRLLDMCAITDTLLADSDGVYHPGLFNDRLILGLNRPETQSTSYSTFCRTTILGTVAQFWTGARLSRRQAVSAADISNVLTGETPAKGTAEAGAIQRRSDFCIVASRRHFVNSGNRFFWRFQRAFSTGSPLHA